VVNAVDPFGRNLGFQDRKPYRLNCKNAILYVNMYVKLGLSQMGRSEAESV
jgi:hypothetical protein